MTPDEEALVAAVTGKLVGRVKRYDRPYKHYLRKGDVFRVLMDTTEPGKNPFDGDNYQVKGVDLVAHMDGRVTGVVYLGREPVGLEMMP